MTPGSDNPRRPTRPWVIVIGAALALLLAVLLIPSRQSQSSSADLRVVCTFLPMYVHTLNLVDGATGVDVQLLAPANTGCPHDYAVRPGDLQRLARANLVVANGLGVDDFINPLLQSSGSKAPIVRLSEGITAIPTSAPDAHAGHDHGPAEDEHAGHDHDEHEPATAPSAHAHDETDHDDHAGHDHAELTINPHVWVSPTLAIRQVHTLAAALVQADPSRAELYRRNEADYVRRLTALAARMQEASKTFQKRDIVTFHDAFAYLARDLGLNVVATLTDNPDHLPSAREMSEAIEKIRQSKPAAIFYEPAYSERLARRISEETGVPLYELNPMNSARGTPAAGTYEEVMNQNLQSLQKALGGPP